MTVLMGLSFVGCGGTSQGEKVDESKLQLYVYNYNGGYKSDWLFSAKKSYEKLHENDEYGEKKGVVININNPKSFLQTAEILSSNDEIFFMEDVYYRQFYNAGVFKDLTSVVTTQSPYDNKTIESKFTDQQKEALNLNGAYYAIPHYSGGYGIIYNVDLFDSNGWYFCAEPTGTEVDDLFVGRSTAKKSAGPDGSFGTADDGLPATYEEFFTLCDYIKSCSAIPFTWPEDYYSLHLEGLLNALIADYEGVDQMKVRIGYDGLATDLCKFVNGTLTKDEVSTQINAENGYEAFRQEGVYYALSFIEKLIKNDYNNKDSLSLDDSEQNYLYAGIDGVTTETAMLLDGDWWQQESDGIFSDIAGAMGSQYSKFNRHFAWMPLPKADESKVGTERIYFDHLGAMACIKSGLSDVQKEVSKLFLQFACTDRSLIEFTNVTGAVKGYDYTKALKEDTSYQNLSYFTKSVVDCIDNGKQLFNVSASKFLNKNYIEIAIGANPGNGGGFDALVNGTGYNSPAGAFKLSEGRVNAETYFVSYYQTKSNSTIWGK